MIDMEKTITKNENTEFNAKDFKDSIFSFNQFKKQS